MRKKNPKVEKVNYSNNAFNRLLKRVGKYRKTITHELSYDDKLHNKLCDASSKYKKGDTWVSNNYDDRGWVKIESDPYLDGSSIYVMTRRTEYTGKKPAARPLDTYYLKLKKEE